METVYENQTLECLVQSDEVLLELVLLELILVESCVGLPGDVYS